MQSFVLISIIEEQAILVELEGLLSRYNIAVFPRSRDLFHRFETDLRRYPQFLHYGLPSCYFSGFGVI